MKNTWQKESECVIKKQDQRSRFLRLTWLKLLQPIKMTILQSKHPMKFKWNPKMKKQQTLLRRIKFVEILQIIKFTTVDRDRKLIYQHGLMVSNFKDPLMVQQLME